MACSSGIHITTTNRPPTNQTNALESPCTPVDGCKDEDEDEDGGGDDGEDGDDDDYDGNDGNDDDDDDDDDDDADDADDDDDDDDDAIVVALSSSCRPPVVVLSS